jgi:hypothetical protein
MTVATSAPTAAPATDVKTTYQALEKKLKELSALSGIR